MPNIHPTAIVEPGAQLDPDVTVGPHACVGPLTKIGAGTEIRHHATVEGRTIIGENNVIFPYACLGGRTQDKKYSGGEPGLRIGDGNVFREFCTVHTATAPENETVIGNRNYFLAYTHVAHDCRLGNGVLMSNNGTLAGHVILEDHAVIMGFGAVHQYCRIGRCAMLGACSKLVQDIPPFMLADGNPAAVRTINKTGLERAGFSPQEIDLAKRIYKILYREGLNRSQALARMREDSLADSPLTRAVTAFTAQSERGLA